MRKAFLTGCGGQDGSYLSELLLSKSYEVHGLIRRSSSPNMERLKDAFESPDFHIHYGDILDGGFLTHLLSDIRPDEIYHLAAQSHVGVSFDIPDFTANVIAIGTLRLLEAIRASGINTRMYSASSSEMFGVSPPPQNETTPFRPVSPYGIAKTFAHNLVSCYRSSYGMWLVNGICFNHESPRRPEEFVTRKITKAVARITLGLQKKLQLGNIKAIRDWGYAPDYVYAMWLMMQAEKPVDYVIATGESHSVQDFVQEAFSSIGISSWKEYVDIYSSSFIRPSEVFYLRGNFQNIKDGLGWTPTLTFKDLVKVMVESDLSKERLKAGGNLK